MLACLSYSCTLGNVRIVRQGIGTHTMALSFKARRLVDEGDSPFFLGIMPGTTDAFLSDS